MSSVNKVCPHCGILFEKPKRTNQAAWEKRKFCSKPCAGKNTPVMTGPDHPLWAGGTTVNSGGYAVFTNSEHNGECQGAYVHRVLMERKIGRKLSTKEHVHHIDGDTLNNDIDNLTIMSATDHARHHAIENKLGHHSRA